MLNPVLVRGLFVISGALKSVILLVIGPIVTPKTEVVEYIRIVISCPIPVGVRHGLVPAPLAVEEEAAVVEEEAAVVAP